MRVRLKFQSSCFLGYHHVVCICKKNTAQAKEVHIERPNRELFNFKLRKKNANLYSYTV